jgi:hypothetical protein
MRLASIQCDGIIDSKPASDVWLIMAARSPCAARRHIPHRNRSRPPAYGMGDKASYLLPVGENRMSMVTVVRVGRFVCDAQHPAPHGGKSREHDLSKCVCRRLARPVDGQCRWDCSLVQLVVAPTKQQASKKSLRCCSL